MKGQGGRKDEGEQGEMGGKKGLDNLPDRAVGRIKWDNPCKLLSTVPDKNLEPSQQLLSSLLFDKDENL